MHTKLWFKAKRFGWGWYPCSWQGWAILAMYIFAVISVAVFIDNHSHSDSDALMGFFPVVYIMTVFLIIICYATGEKPAWNWGTKNAALAHTQSKTIDVLDPEGNPTGDKADIYEVHKHGYWHRTSNVYIINSKNEILLQRRSKNHAVFPNMWQGSAAGHILSGETSLQSAKSETKEEIGLDLPDSAFEYIGTSLKNEVQVHGTILDKEYQDIYVVHMDIGLDQLQKQKSEVEDLRWFSYSELQRCLKNHDPEFVQHASIPFLFGYMDTYLSRHGSDKN